MPWWENQYNNCVITDTSVETIKERLSYFVAYVLNLCVPVIQMRKSLDDKNLREAEDDLHALSAVQQFQDTVGKRLGNGGSKPRELEDKQDAVQRARDTAFGQPDNLL